jgi:hypothetical protein
MTRAQPRAHWSGVPSFSQPLLAALLRAVAMLMSFAAPFLRMRPSLLPRECHTDVEPQALPAWESSMMETHTPAATDGDANQANNALNGSFSGLSRESRFGRRGNRRDRPQSPSGDNRDSRDALRLPENDAGEITIAGRPWTRCCRCCTTFSAGAGAGGTHLPLERGGRSQRSWRRVWVEPRSGDPSSRARS